MSGAQRSYSPPCTHDAAVGALCFACEIALRRRAVCEVAVESVDAAPPVALTMVGEVVTRIDGVVRRIPPRVKRECVDGEAVWL